MEKNEYLNIVLDQLSELSKDDTLTRHIYQVRAKAIQSELLDELPEVKFQFDEKHISKISDFLFSEAAKLIREQIGDKKYLLSLIRNAGDTFEFLSKFASEEDREFLIIKSALCNQIAGYQANAQCLARQVEEKYLPALNFDLITEDSLVLFFRHSLINFIRHDIRKLKSVSTKSLAAISELQLVITKKLSENNASLSDVYSLVGFAFFMSAMKNFSAYCLSGYKNDIDITRSEISKSYINFQRANETTLSTITLELITFLDQFSERSTWSTLQQYANVFVENPLVKVYFRNLASQKSIVEFWQSQLKAIKSGILNDEKSFLVQMPTSSGKTLIAELAILSRLAKDPQSRCLYIAPYKALVNEIERDFTSTLGAIGIRVSSLLGGFEFDAFEDFLLQESQVLIATPEKVDIFFRSHPEYFSKVSLIVVDEGHIVDEGISDENDSISKSVLEELNERNSTGRGVLLELLITRLIKKLPSAKFLYISAVMPEINSKDFLAWLSTKEDGFLNIERTDRPSRQTIASFQWANNENGELDYLSLPILPSGRPPFVPFFVQRKRAQYLTGANTPTGRPEKMTWPQNIDNRTQSTSAIACKFSKIGPVLVFCATKNDVKNVTENILKFLNLLESSDQLPHQLLGYSETPNLETYELSKEWLGEDNLLTRALHRGVAFHFGPLPQQIRQSIEDEFRKNRIRILVSTNTLAQGVNLPIKTAIIHSLEHSLEAPNEEGVQSVYKVKKRDFWNICGRAGRAGKETEGQIIFTNITERDKRIIKEYLNPDNIEEVNSTLYKILIALANQRISSEELYQYFDSHILAIMSEEVVDTDDGEAINEFLKTSLVGIQATRNNQDLTPLINTLKNTSKWIKEKNIDSSLLRVFAKTGLRLSSCLALSSAADEFCKSISNEFLISQSKEKTCNFDILKVAFEACKELPEMLFKTRTGISYKGPSDEFEFIQAWVSGNSVGELRSKYWDPSDTESLSEYLSDRVTYKLPWGLHSFLIIMAHTLNQQFENLPMLWQNMPSMVKFGVNNLISSWAGSIGVSSREIAIRLSEKYQSEQVSFPNFIKWIANLSTDFVEHEIIASENQKMRFLSEISKIIPDKTILSFWANTQKEINVGVEGINYNQRDLVAKQIRIGDALSLEPEPTNPKDPYAVKVLFNNQILGYIERDKSKFVVQEVELGNVKSVIALSVTLPSDSYSSHLVDLRISFY